MSLRERAEGAVQEAAMQYLGESSIIPSSRKGRESPNEEQETGTEGTRRRPKVPPVLLGTIGLACLAVLCAVVGTGSFSIQTVDSLGSPLSLDTKTEVGDTDSLEVKTAVNGANQMEKTALEEICVYVTGAVKNPGVYDLSIDARVNDAVLAAGGLEDNAAASSVNLARILSDGEQVDIPTKDQVNNGVDNTQSNSMAVNDENATNRGASGNNPTVNINTATCSELQALPGIGEALAQRIIDDRAANGPFGKPADLTRVSGIGEKKLADMESMIAVG